MSESLEFSCPSCHTGLRVPVRLAGITGPCPHCGVDITSPTLPGSAPTEDTTAKQVEDPKAPAQEKKEVSPLPPPAQPQARPALVPPAPKPVETSTSRPERTIDPATKATTYRKRRQLSPWVLRGVLMLLLAIVLYWFLGYLKLVGPNKNRPPVEPKKEAAREKIETTSIPEPPEPTPPIVVEPSPIPAEEDSDSNGTKMDLQKRAVLIESAQQVLRQFLDAKSYDERKPLMTASKRSEEELRQSCLASSFASILEPSVETILERKGDRPMEVFFSVPFDQPGEVRQRLILVRVVSVEPGESPLVHADPFIDLYEKRAVEFGKEPVIGSQTFYAIIEASAYCFDDIPRAEGKAKIQLFENTTKDSQPITAAYLLRDSSIFSTIRQFATPKVRIPCVISLSWDRESDPNKPYLQVARLNSPNWTD